VQIQKIQVNALKININLHFYLTYLLIIYTDDITMLAYNEETNIPILIERVTKALPCIDYELIIVDDGSIDNTADVAKKFEDKHPIRVIRHEHNKGKIEALKTGLQVARGRLEAAERAPSRLDGYLCFFQIT